MTEPTGGGGRAVYRVSIADDDRRNPPPGSLRAAVTKARSDGGIIRVEFCGKPIRLSAPLHLGDNLTVEGKCAQPVGILGPNRGSIFYIDGSKNVIIRNLSLSFESLPQSRSTGDCVTVRGGADMVLIVDSHFSRCRDGMVDVTQVEGDDPTRVTIERNLFTDHDKAFLISAPAKGSCNDDAFAIRVAIRDNVMRNIGQRIPRASGAVYVHLVGNEISVSPQSRPGGKLGGTYVAYASQGAKIFAERNRLHNLSDRKIRGLWVGKQRSSDKCSFDGAIRSENNIIDESFINHLGESERVDPIP